MHLGNGFVIEQFAAVVAAPTVADPHHLVAATVFAKDHALRFLPINNCLISFCEYSTYMYKYDEDCTLYSHDQC